MSSTRLWNFVNEIKSPPYKEWVTMYLNGDSIQEIAKKCGKHSSLIQMVIQAIFREHIDYYEHKYAYIFQRYKFSPDAFSLMTGEDSAVYRYLYAAYGRGEKSLSLILEDDSVPPEWRSALLPLLNKRDEQATASNQRLVHSLNKPSKSQDNRITQAVDYCPKDSKAYQRIIKRINKQFDVKFYIGDILVRDNEFVELLAYAQTQILHIVDTQSIISDAPILAVTLVQIGIRCYDGNFWKHAAKALHIDNTPMMQRWVGKTFISTLELHKKYIISKNERVNSILFHTFVSNYYAKGLFELLFQYYTRDLERDIYRNTKEQMQLLMDTLKHTSNLSVAGSEMFADQFMGSKAYKLRHHTLAAISANPTHAKRRLSRLLRLIDRAFWKNETPANPSSRLTIRFKEWCTDSPSFTKDHNLYLRGEIRNRGKKHFSEPYLFSDISEGKFLIKFPEQLIKEEYISGLQWEISTCARTFHLDVPTYLAVTARKTEALLSPISNDELLGAMEFRLICDEGTVRRFPTLPRSSVRFFDMEGDYSRRLFRIPMCAYSSSDTILESSALLDHTVYKDLIRWDFSFEDGDIVVLPDKTALSVGDYYQDGFLPRGKVPSAYCKLEGNERLPVYAEYPEMLLTIPQSKINGTVIEVNQVRYALGSCDYRSFVMKDSKGEQAILVSTKQFGEIEDHAKNSIYLDVPGNRNGRPYSFCLIKGFFAKFSDSPYVFDDRAVVSFPEGLAVQCVTATAQKNDESSYSIMLTEAVNTLEVRIANMPQTLELNIPVLLWSMDKIQWNIAEFGEIWHTKLPQKIFFKSPEAKLFLETDFDSDDEEDSETHSVPAESVSGGMYCIDLARFHSWFTGNKIAHKLYIRLNKQTYLFGTVFARSYVSSASIFADFAQNKLFLQADIIGQATYYADIKNISTGEIVADKQIIETNITTFDVPHLSGRYFVELFEAEDDGSGFDDPDYSSIFCETWVLADKNDLTGKCLHVSQIYYHALKQFTELGADYWVSNLKRIGTDLYVGSLQVGDNPQRRQVKIFFPDRENLRFFNIEFWDDEEEAYFEYIFDSQERIFTKKEPDNMKRSVRYRRYRLLEREDYSICGKLCDETDVKSPESVWDRYKCLSIYGSALSPQSIYLLMDNGYMYLNELTDKTTTSLMNIRGMKYENAKEIQRYLQKVKEDIKKKGAEEI